MEQKENQVSRDEYNNSSLIADLQFNECDDVTTILLHHDWKRSKSQVQASFQNFDIIVACGETEKLDDHAEIEAFAKVNGNLVENETLNLSRFPKMSHIKINNEYDEENNYTCNKLNYFLIKNKKTSLFIHVPVSIKKNKQIKRNLLKLLLYLRKLPRSEHTLMADFEDNYEIGYTDVTPDDFPPFTCRIGIYFPFRSLQTHYMTMAQTYIDLDIIFLAKNGEVLYIKNAKSRSKYDIKFRSYNVLEMPTPYCKSNYIKRGTYLKIINADKRWSTETSPYGHSPF